MSKIELESYKGVRDFYPDDYKIFEYIVSKWRETMILNGFEEYNASILEPTELYKSKTSEEIVNDQTYNFIDRGERNVTLRPEMTPTVVRMISKKRKEFSLPIKWFSIPNVFRYEQPQKGRLREHWQLNADIFGESKTEAEVELIKIAYDLMINLGLKSKDFVVKINDREIINRIFKEYNLEEEKIRQIIRLIDKKDKIDNFGEEFFKLTGQEFNFSAQISSKLQEVINKLNNLGVNNIVFDPLLARGFDYYTGIVFEIFDTDPENKRALFGGGRYDKLFELFQDEEIPAIGFGVGDVTIKDALEIRNLLPENLKDEHLYLALFDKNLFEGGYKIIEELQKNNVKTYFDYSDRKIKNKIERADKQNYRFFSVIGEDEIKSNKIIIKDLKTGKEKKLKIKKVSSYIKKIIKPSYGIFSI